MCEAAQINTWAPCCMLSSAAIPSTLRRAARWKRRKQHGLLRRLCVPRGTVAARMSRHQNLGAPGARSSLSKPGGCGARGAGFAASGAVAAAHGSPPDLPPCCAAVLRASCNSQVVCGIGARTADRAAAALPCTRLAFWRPHGGLCGGRARIETGCNTSRVTRPAAIGSCSSPRPRCRAHCDQSKRVCSPRPQAAREPCACCRAVLQRHHVHHGGRRPQRGIDQSRNAWARGAWAGPSLPTQRRRSRRGRRRRHRQVAVCCGLPHQPKAAASRPAQRARSECKALQTRI